VEENVIRHVTTGLDVVLVAAAVLLAPMSAAAQLQEIRQTIFGMD
jgi:hypothetical protein